MKRTQTAKTFDSLWHRILKDTVIHSERPEWNFTETGPEPKYFYWIGTKPEPKLNTDNTKPII